MNRTTSMTCLLAALGWPLLADAAIEELLARQIYSTSGARTQLESVALQVPADVREAAEESKSAQRVPADKMETVARSAYGVENTEKVLIAQLQAQLQPAEAQEVLGWLQSPLGRKFTELGVQASRPDEQLKLQQYAQAIVDKPPPEPRVALMESLQKGMHLTEISTQLLMHMRLASGIVLLENPHDEKAIRRLRDSSAVDRAQMTSEVGALMLVVLMYTFRDVEDADVQRYVDFCNSPAGARYYQAVSGGIDRALMAAGMSMGQELGKLAATR